MRSTSYWNKRMQILEQSRYDGNVQSFYEIERIYRKQLAEMQKEINAWYGRFAQNNEISLADARKLLDDKQLDELKWNVQDYIKYGRENALDPKWIKQLENASARYHISRLEALQLQLQQRAESVMSGELDVVDARVRDVYQENYYHTAFEIQRGIGVGWDLERLDDRRIDKVISKPWAVDGKNFSERIWEQRDKLVNTLHQELTQSIIRGESPERAIKTLADRMEVSKSNARRLIMTESAAIASAAQQECYNELDVEQYKIVATLDDVTCDICAGLDGSIFKMSEYSVGTTAPPFHPNCRTVTVPYFADDNSSKRAARGADGKTYLVPADTKFTDWKKAFIDGEEKPFKVMPEPEPKPDEPKELTFEEKINQVREEFISIKQEYDDLNAKTDKLKAENNADDQRKAPFKQRSIQIRNQLQEYNRYRNFNFDAEIERLRIKIQSAGSWGNIYQSNIDKTIEIRDRIQSMTQEKLLALRNEQNDINVKISEIEKRIADRNDQIKTIDKDKSKIAAKMEPTIKKAGKITHESIRNDPKYRDVIDRLKRNEDRQNELNKLLMDMSKKPIEEQDQELMQKWGDEFWRLMDEHSELYKNKFFDRAECVKNVLGQVREMGSQKVDMKKHIATKKSKVMDAVLKAYDVYPSDFCVASEKRSQIELKKVGRGYYFDGQPSTIAISGVGQSAFKTAIHELGHRMEKAIPLIRDLEQAFYERRTNGEPLQRLKDIYPNSGYGAKEKTRKDNFIHAYMGKDYGGDAYELVSMGFENAYADPEELAKDPDMAEWIYGILTLI